MTGVPGPETSVKTVTSRPAVGSLTRRSAAISGSTPAMTMSSVPAAKAARAGGKTRLNGAAP